LAINTAASTTLENRTPLEVLTVVMPDIRPLLCFSWWAPVYYANKDATFGSESPELRGNFVGISEHVSHAMSYKVLTHNTLKITHRSNMGPATDPNALNLCADLKNRGNYNDGFDFPSHIIC